MYRFAPFAPTLESTIAPHGSFKAFSIFNDEGRIAGRVVDSTLDELTPGDVVIRAAYSSVNYKDALAATGGKIIRQFPRIGGIDVAGVVESSSDARYRAGDPVIVTGYGLGVENDGGYSELVRVPGDWIVPLPDGLTLFEAMALGTAGFTAALAVMRLEQMGVRPVRGPVAVTGSTGGVGSVAVAALTRLGYTVTAITGKDTEHDYLRSLGAADILSRHTIEFSARPIESGRWAAAVDAAGGDLLSWLVKTTQPWGAVASTGLDGRDRPAPHRNPVHPARRKPHRHRLGDLPDEHPPRGVEPARDRHEATEPSGDDPRDPARRSARRIHDAGQWAGARPLRRQTPKVVSGRRRRQYRAWHSIARGA